MESYVSELTIFANQSNSVAKIEIFKNKGILNDKHFHSVKAITILLNNDDFELAGLCFKKFKPNIVLENIKVLKLGNRLLINDSLLEITEVGKNCYLNCDIGEDSKNCSLKNNVLVAKVVKSGHINLNDSVKVITF